MSAPVVLAPHDPAFATFAKTEAQRWQEACGSDLLDFHHIGSTAVPGLIAKPVLDLMPVFASLQKLDALCDRIRMLGVEWWGAYGLAGRRYCKRVESDPVQHIHCYAAGADDITRHLAFRDYLRTHPDVAKDYAGIKIACAAQHQTDLSTYVDCKSDWIKATETKALIWHAQRAST